MTARRRTTALPAVLLLALAGLAGCGGDEPTTAPPQAAPESPSPKPSPSRSPSPSPSPSPPPPPPLSPFEDDPAVQGLRAYLAAVSEGLNAGDLQLPALAETSTASRHAMHPELFADDLGAFYPGPVPFEIRSVSTVSPTERLVLGCVADSGHGLTAPGGEPSAPLEIVSTETTVRMEDGAWRVHDAVAADGVDCAGLTLEEMTS